MKNILILIASFIFFQLSSHAQIDKIKNFTYLKSSGNIPQEFLTLSAHKSKKDYDENKDKGLDKDFFLSTRFFIDELLLSGDILFNEDLSNYVQKVAKYVLRKNKNLYKELQFYVLKSNAVNAFSTDQGIIFFTTGLLAQLEDEAQLAFILAHEISHYTEKHVREGYVENQNIRSGKGKYKRLSYDDKVSELSTYSKDNEHQADNEGVELFLNTQYDIESIFTSFEVLLYAYLPFEDIKFDSTFFNTDHLYIPGTMFPDSINQISREEDFDDDLSTHPNIQKRMDKTFDVIGDRVSKGTLKYKISEETFKNIRTLARFESVNQSLANRDYIDAIYSIFLLQRKYTDNKFLEFSLAKALYGLAKYKNHARYNEVIPKLKRTEGEIYSVAYFFKKLKNEHINVLAYRYIYDLTIKYKDDKIIQKYERDMLKEIALHSEIEPDLLLATDFKTYNDSIVSVISTFNVQDSIASIDANDNLSKYKKIKLKKALRNLDGKSANKITAEQFHITGLSDIIQKGNFLKDIEFFKAQEEIAIAKEKEERLDKKKKEEGLGINKIVVVDPYLADYGVNNKKNKVKSEKKKIELNEMYQTSQNKLDIQTILVDSKSLSSSDVDKYNEIGLLYNWVSEVLEHDEIEMISSSNSNMQSLKEKYGTEHFLFSGFIKYKERNEFTMTHLAGIFYVVTAPIAIIDLLVIHNYFETFSFAINTDSDKLEYTNTDQVNLKASKYVIQAYIYNTLYNLNKK